jgi:predicted transcriptional regulator
MADAIPTSELSRLDGLRAADVMNTSIRTCSRFSSVMEAVLIFKDEDCGMVPVVEDGKPIGVVTDRDIALSLASTGDVLGRPVSEIMTENLVAISHDTPLRGVVREFGREGVRRLLVIDDTGLLAGVVSWGDLLPYLPESLFGQMVGDVVEQQVSD